MHNIWGSTTGILLDLSLDSKPDFHLPCQWAAFLLSTVKHHRANEIIPRLWKLESYCDKITVAVTLREKVVLQKVETRYTNAYHVKIL